MKRGHWVIGLVLATAMIVPAVVADAVFNASASKAGGVIVNGDLRLTQGSSVSWVETTAAVPAGQRRSGADFASLAGFVGVPGDTVEVRYPVTTTLVGDNLSAVVRASLGTLPQPLPAGVTIGRYRVLSTAGAAIAPASGYSTLGQTTVVSSLTAAGTSSFLIAVQVSWGAGSAPAYTSDLTASGGGFALTVVPITIGLEQVRSGAGFVP